MLRNSSRAIRAIGVLGTVVSAACAGEPTGPNFVPEDGGPYPPSISSTMSRVNEPAGYLRFAEAYMDRLPAKSYGPVTGWIGNWMYSGVGTALEPATNLLTSSPGVLRTSYSKSLLAGRAPTSIAGWSGSQSSPSQYRKVYFSQWIKVGTTAGYQNNPLGTKFGFFGYGQPTNLARNQSCLMIMGTGTTSVMTSMELRFMQQNTVVRNVGPNRSISQAKLTTGVWHQIEVSLEANSAAGVADGKLKIWLDGVQIHDWTNMVYLTAGNTKRFQWYDWNPTWGGTMGARTQADNIWTDHLYISGMP